MEVRLLRRDRRDRGAVRLALSPLQAPRLAVARPRPSDGEVAASYADGGVMVRGDVGAYDLLGLGLLLGCRFLLGGDLLLGRRLLLGRSLARGRLLCRSLGGSLLRPGTRLRHRLAGR